MKFSDAALGGFLTCFALAMMAYASTFPQPQGSPFGAALFPLAIGGLMVCAGVALVVRAVRSGAVRPLVEVDPWMRQARPALNAALVLGLPILYILAADTVGFIPLAALLLFGLTWQLGGGPRAAILSALLVPLAIHTFFVKLLLVPLPWGLLSGVAW